MKKLMILGAGYTQIPLMEAAGRLGVHTIAASIPGDYPGFAHADEQVYVDIANPQAVKKAAAHLSVDGIATCGLDLGMRAIGAACEALHLPGPSGAAAEKASDKYEMKKALTAAGVQTARFFCIRSEAELEEAMEQLPFPVIVKAVDLMGSRGIFRSDTREEARENYKKTMEATKKDYCLIEEFIEGEIFGVEAMIQHGKMLFMLPNNIEAFVSATPTPVGHSVPFRELDMLGGMIEEQTELAVRALGLDNCPLNCDFIKKDGKVYVIELTGRSGATGLSEMTGAYFGLDYYEMIVRLALGEPMEQYFANTGPGTPNLAHTLMSDRRGILRNIRNENRASEDIVELSFNVGPGDEVRPYTNGMDRIGQVILKGDSLEACERRLQEVLANIHLELESDLPICETPVHFLERDAAGNDIYLKREDMLPFSFGGNKVRFAQGYLRDMEEKGCDAMIIYGGYHSNLCRILAAACAGRGIPCSMVHNVDDAEPGEESGNTNLIRLAGVGEYRCRKGEIARAVQAAMDDFTQAGKKPYYIHGNIYGQGNVTVPMETYVQVYREILKQEQEMGVHFDYIFLASSTNTTQSGLLAAHLMTGDVRKIVGISVTRQAERAVSVICDNLKEYENKKNVFYRLDGEQEIFLEDRYLAGGYGCADEEIMETIRRTYTHHGVPLDPTYTGKGFRGMSEYLKEHKIQGKKILFLHTGGAPLFFDALPGLERKGESTC